MKSKKLTSQMEKISSWASFSSSSDEEIGGINKNAGKKDSGKASPVLVSSSNFTVTDTFSNVGIKSAEFC